MTYLALATDYDGTIATHGHVDAITVAAMQRLKDSGRRLLLVTGRELGDMQALFPRLDLFDRCVLENGAILYDPQTQNLRQLGEAPPAALVNRLRQRGVSPLWIGQGIVATEQPWDTEVLAAIRDLGLEWQVVFNKGSVMVLPSGVNKATGLHAALAELQIAAENVVGVGDAENDHAFLNLCGCAAAVGNALAALKERADIVLNGHAGVGVQQLIERLLHDDLHGIGRGVAIAEKSS